MEAAVPAEEALVLVEYGFEYRAKDGTLVSIKPNERYVLLKRTNHHWWHVKRSGDARPFYIPAQYVKELPPIATPAPLNPAPPGYTGMDPATLIPQQAPAYEYRFIGATETEEPERGCSVPRGDSVPRRDSPPVLSSFRAPPSLRPEPTDPVRPSHSLDDLARVTPAPRSATTTGSHRDPPGHIRPLSKSHSETLCAPGRDRDVARRRPGPGHAAQAQPEPEEPPAPIYLNLQELREAAAAAAVGSSQEEPFSSVSDWETHRDTDTGHLFYYNPVTGETTWDCPFGQAGDGVRRRGTPPTPEEHRTCTPGGRGTEPWSTGHPLQKRIIPTCVQMSWRVIPSTAHQWAPMIRRQLSVCLQGALRSWAQPQAGLGAATPRGACSAPSTSPPTRGHGAARPGPAAAPAWTAGSSPCCQHQGLGRRS